MRLRLGPRRRPALEQAAREARAGVFLPVVASRFGFDEGAVLAAAGLTFEAQRHRNMVRADLAFAAREPLTSVELDAEVARRVGDAP